MSDAAGVTDVEVRALVEALYAHFHHDFRHYAMASLKRRVSLGLTRLRCATVSELQDKVLRDKTAFSVFLQLVTVQVSEMFRDPPFYRWLREQIFPELSSYPSLRVWVAGCSTGEEVYSLVILLAEEGLLDRTLIYATDINPEALASARSRVYSLERLSGFSKSYFEAGGKASLSSYFHAAYGGAIFDRALASNVVFADHSLATDAVFAEVQLLTCRNVLIYFDRALQDRALGLFKDALCRRGFLGLGPRETVRYSPHAASFRALRAGESWYQRC